MFHHGFTVASDIGEVTIFARDEPMFALFANDSIRENKIAIVFILIYESAN